MSATGWGPATDLRRSATCAPLAGDTAGNMTTTPKSAANNNEMEAKRRSHVGFLLILFPVRTRAIQTPYLIGFIASSAQRKKIEQTNPNLGR
jgi:hypothetical protein